MCWKEAHPDPHIILMLSSHYPHSILIWSSFYPHRYEPDDSDVMFINNGVEDVLEGGSSRPSHYPHIILILSSHYPHMILILSSFYPHRYEPDDSDVMFINNGVEDVLEGGSSRPSHYPHVILILSSYYPHSILIQSSQIWAGRFRCYVYQ